MPKPTRLRPSEGGEMWGPTAAPVLTGETIQDRYGDLRRAIAERRRLSATLTRKLERLWNVPPPGGGFGFFMRWPSRSTTIINGAVLIGPGAAEEIANRIARVTTEYGDYFVFAGGLDGTFLAFELNAYGDPRWDFDVDRGGCGSWAEGRVRPEPADLDPLVPPGVRSLYVANHPDDGNGWVWPVGRWGSPSPYPVWPGFVRRALRFDELREGRDYRVFNEDPAAAGTPIRQTVARITEVSGNGVHWGWFDNRAAFSPRSYVDDNKIRFYALDR